MIRWLVHHATTSVIGVLILFVFGLSAYVSLPRESTPDVKIPFIIVSTPYVGVSPADVESLITIPIENELASLTDVKQMSSSSMEGASVIAIEFEPEVDIDEALQKVRDRVSRAKSDLPTDAEEPNVAEVSFSDIPILLVTISGGVDEQELKRIAEDLEDDVARIPGVLEAEVTGGREREIRVQVLPDRLAHYGLSLDDVVGAIRSENVNIPGGDVTAGRATFLLRIPGEFTDPAQIEGVAIKRVGDRPVFVSDVARVVDAFEDRQTYSRMMGRPSVTLAVKKRTGANLLQVADAVRALVEERAERWPEGVTYEVLGDQSENIASMVLELQNNIITALLLVAGVLFVFMGARNALFVACAIPLSMLMSFMVVQALGYTLNMVVLFALILALGMLVDNGIVVVENVYRHLEMGKSKIDAAIDGTGEIAMPVAASTATTVAAFFPLVFWTGIMGQFMGFLPKTVIIVLTSSLVVAVWVLPVMLSRWAGDPAPREDGRVDDDATPIDPRQLGPFMRRYHDLLRLAIRRRFVTIALGLGVLLVSFVAYGFLGHGVEFFPATEPDRATIAVRLPEGADLDATDRVVRLVEAALAEVENVDTFVADVGVSGGGDPLAGASNAENQARITVDFLPAPDQASPGERPRVEPTSLTILKLRAAFARIPGAEISVEQEVMGPPVGDPILVEVSGDDFHQVGDAALALKRAIEENVPGVAELETDYRVGRPELQLRVDRGAAKRVGVSTQAIGGAVRTAIAGTEASALRDGEDEYDIVVEVAPEYKQDLQRILTLRVPGREDTSPSTFPVPLSAVADYELGGGSGTIRHVDQDLVVTISGDVLRKDQEAMVRQAVAEFVAQWEAPPGIHAQLGGAAEEQAEAVAFLGWAFGLAVALILLVLVIQFDSVAIPLMIGFTVVLSLVGVLWGLILTGTPFGIIMTGIGVISLAGVVVNNAIVLLDFVQQLKDKGLDTEAAIIRAGVTRFRPVMLTAITTVLGLVPMAAGISVDFVNLRFALGSSSAQFWGPMAVAVIFGLAFATVLTLVMVPTLYALYDQLLLARGADAKRGVAQAAKALAATLLPAALLLPGVARAVTLDDAIAAAERHNVDLRLQIEAEIQAASQRWQALSTMLPRVTVGATYAINQNEVIWDMSGGSDGPPDDVDLGAFAPLFTHPDSPFTLPFLTEALAPAFEEMFTGGMGGMGDLGDGPIVVQAKSQWTGNLHVYQPLLNGSAFPAFSAATNQWRAAKSDTATVRQRVRAAVARAYYGLAATRQAVEVAEASLAVTREQVALAERQVAAGLADQLAVMQARLALSQGQRDLLAAREQVVEAEQSFARLTGLPPDVPVEAPPAVTVPADVEEAVRIARESRPDLRAAEYRATAARKVAVARNLEWMPSIDLTFTESYTQYPGFVPHHFQWRVGLNASWTLLDGGRRIFRSRELASQVRAARLQVERVLQETEQDVRVDFERLGRAQQAYQTVLEEVKLAEATLERAQARFTAGRATYLDVEQARLALDNARLGIVRERMNRDVAAIDLLTAIGRY